MGCATHVEEDLNGYAFLVLTLLSLLLLLLLLLLLRWWLCWDLVVVRVVVVVVVAPVVVALVLGLVLVAVAVVVIIVLIVSMIFDYCRDQCQDHDHDASLGQVLPACAIWGSLWLIIFMSQSLVDGVHLPYLSGASKAADCRFSCASRGQRFNLSYFT